MGVGVALVRAELHRRADPATNGHARRRRRQRPALLPGEPVGEGLRRVLLGQLDLAIELLVSYSGEDGDQTVHETRKVLKRLRALLRLVRPELDARGGLTTELDARGGLTEPDTRSGLTTELDTQGGLTPELDTQGGLTELEAGGGLTYALANTVLRDCARRLAGARDAEVMVLTLDTLTARHPPLARSAAVRGLHMELLHERDAAAEQAIRDPQVRGEVVRELGALRACVARWQPRSRGFRLVAPGLERLYRRGRRGLRGARKGDGGSEVLHAWRKHVKDLRYAAEALDRGGKEAGQAATRLRRAARRADRLGEVLGDEHDLALLAEGVRARSAHFAGERRTRKHLLKLIARRRRALRERALREGARLYRRPPRRFVRRARHAG